MANLLKMRDGFTLVEALLSVVILGLIAAGISAPYISGLRSLEVQADRMLLDSHLRGQMEKLIGLPFDHDDLDLGTKSVPVTVRGKNYTITWTVSSVDLNADSNPEPNARKITVSVFGRTLTTIVVDHEGKVGKI
ncbi:MAG: prepilin-type N-terminal cleavage/methylation domain-containing protein [Desulfobacterales bacterium]|nr:prepilin-type N-terminal cleavage/methylation domain-containing protein [Desulfobacterales bacterium]